MAPDFSGWATKEGLRCADGLTIGKGAFKHQAQKMRVPLVWQHQHDDVKNVLGHVILEHRDGGVYAQGFFNDTEDGLHAKSMVEHGDVDSMSIFANQLKKQNNVVNHGNIREVSLVLAGANPGALIENVYIQHGDGDLAVVDGEAVITTGLYFSHSDSDDEEAPDTEGAEVADENTDEKTVEDILESMTDEERAVVQFVAEEAVKVALAAEKDDKDDKDDKNDAVKQGELLDGDEILAHINKEIEKGFTEMHNIFENNGKSAAGGDTLRHSFDAGEEAQIFDAMKRTNSAKAYLEELAHAGTYGINSIDLLFPDAKTIENSPQVISRRVEWVDKVLGAVNRRPFAKIKSIQADLTGPEARARGYIKGNEKVDEVLALLKRTTGPTTIYKKQKLDRDDIIDITDFDVVAWLKWEIRYMLDEEIARAILIGDGRSAASPDKIKDPAGSNDGNGIRSIFKDADLYAVKVVLPANINVKARIKEIAASRRLYRGSGTPTLYTTDAEITAMLLLEDNIGRRLYDTEAALASALRVKEIVAVEVMEDEAQLLGIIVNLVDYTVGTNKGGELTFFQDFDIDFNQEKYLMETRASGALTRPKSALVIQRQQGTAVTPTAPSFDGPTNKLTIPNKTGVQYLVNGVAKDAGDITITEDVLVEAEAKTGYYIPSSDNTSWNFTHTP